MVYQLVGGEINLSRLRVSGNLLELGADDLRFRSWEVEELFRDFYAEPLPPVDLAELTRRTAGCGVKPAAFRRCTWPRMTRIRVAWCV